MKLLHSCRNSKTIQSWRCCWTMLAVRILSESSSCHVFGLGILFRLMYEFLHKWALYCHCIAAVVVTISVVGSKSVMEKTFNYLWHRNATQGFMSFCCTCCVAGGDFFCCNLRDILLIYFLTPSRSWWNQWRSHGSCSWVKTMMISHFLSYSHKDLCLHPSSRYLPSLLVQFSLQSHRIVWSFLCNLIELCGVFSAIS